MPTQCILCLGRLAIGTIQHAKRNGMTGVFIDADPALCAKAAQLGAPVYESLDAAMTGHSNVAAVHIATPNHTHVDLAIKFAAWNVPVLMEKPLGLDKEECRRVLDAYAKSRGWLQLDFEYRASRLFTQAAEILDSGELGDLRSLHIEYTIGPEPDKRGGFFREMLLNYIDLIRFWTKSNVASIHVGAAPCTMDNYLPNTTDFVAAHYVMENSVFASILHTNCCTAMPQASEESLEDWSEFGHRNCIYLNTTRGCLIIDIWKRRITVIQRDPDDNNVPRIIRRIDHKHVPFTVSHHDMDAVQKDFVGRVVRGEGPRWTLADGYQSMLAALESDEQSAPACLVANARFNPKK